MLGGQPNLIPTGRVAVPEVIENYQPLAGLHGHIHECRGAVEPGHAPCLNSGGEYSEGILRRELASISGGQLKSYQFVADRDQSGAT